MIRQGASNTVLRFVHTYYLLILHFTGSLTIFAYVAAYLVLAPAEHAHGQVITLWR